MMKRQLSMGVDKTGTRNMPEHSRKSRNIPEHQKIKKFSWKKKKNNNNNNKMIFVKINNNVK